MLRVRDSRITRTSLTRWHSTLDPRPRPSLPDTDEDRYSWEYAAHLLETTVAEIQNLVRIGKLNMADTFVTERSFEEFCRKRGSEINMCLLDRATEQWLTREYGVLPGSRTVPRAQKHVLIVRTCACGRKIAGNIFFKHLKHCPIAARKRLPTEIGPQLPPVRPASAGRQTTADRFGAAAGLA
jgi:hypothetical protein